jgi:hypothetical protein
MRDAFHCAISRIASGACSGVHSCSGIQLLAVLPLVWGRITPPMHLGAAEDFLYCTLRVGAPTFTGAFATRLPFPAK